MSAGPAVQLLTEFRLRRNVPRKCHCGETGGVAMSAAEFRLRRNVPRGPAVQRVLEFRMRRNVPCRSANVVRSKVSNEYLAR